MTLIAELDHNEDPAVVVTLYDYGEDDVPPHMTEPHFVDVTDEDPRPAPGYTYDGKKFKPGHPQKQEAQRSVGRQALLDALETNEQYLADSPAPKGKSGDVTEQVSALTRQMNLMIRGSLQEYPAAPEPGHPLPLPGDAILDPHPEHPIVLPPDEVPPDEPAEPEPLAASFTFTPAAPTRTDEVQFDATASTGAIARYDWDFGAGEGVAADLGPTPTYLYGKKGSFDVTLTVTDEDALTDQAVATITI